VTRSAVIPRLAAGAMGYPYIRAVSLAIAVAGLVAATVVAPRHPDCSDLVAGAFVHQHRPDLEATAAGVLRGRPGIARVRQALGGTARC
jgi:hypothetical protein